MLKELEGKRDGETFDPFKDMDRLNAQMKRVFRTMCDSGWRSLRELSDVTGDPEASVSARLRDFRKPRFGELVVNRRRREAGVFEYQLVPSEAYRAVPAGMLF